jgi:hypothetical protein
MKHFVFALSTAAAAAGFMQPSIADEKAEASVAKATLEVESSALQEDDEKTPESGEDNKKDFVENKVVVEVRTSDENNSKEADGDVKVSKVRGRIIMFGPDGERKELELDEKQLKKFQFKVDGSGDIEQIHEQLKSLSEAETEAKTEERFVIGVQCEEADELLRKHLKLQGKGLIVLEVREDTPAAEAGLKIDDVIVAVGEHPLNSREDLVSAVHDSEGKELAVHIVRDGEPLTVAVTPKKMKVPVITETTTVEGTAIPNIMIHDGKPLTALPGLFIEGQPQDPNDVKKLVDQLQLDSLRHRVEGRKSLEDEIETLRKELKALREEMQSLRKTEKDK